MPLGEIFVIVVKSALFSASVDLCKAVKAGVSAGKSVNEIVGASKKRWSSERNKRTLVECAKSYTPAEITDATEHYIEPFCQSTDPAGAEDFKHTVITKQRAFEVLDNFVFGTPDYRHYIVLADSGMGKTSLLLNYLARHVRLRKTMPTLALIPLSRKDSDAKIADIPKETRPATTLLLDALDEDIQAIENTEKRIHAILALTRDFQKVLITCRTQFFGREQEIPTELGIIKVGGIRLGESGTYQLGKVYLSPFNEAQVTAYINHVFPFWRPENRAAARRLVLQVADLSVRPMLLAYLPQLVKSGRHLRYSSQVFDELVEGWLKREKRVDGVKPEILRRISDRLALDIYSKAAIRGEEKITVQELKILLADWGIPDDEWQARQRSLLNHDSDGKLKFAHRSIMEFLLIKQFVNEPASFPQLKWTDRMKRICWEMLTLENIEGRKVNLANADLSEFYASRPSYLTVADRMRKVAATFDSELITTGTVKETLAGEIFAEVPQVISALPEIPCLDEVTFILKEPSLRFLIRDRSVELIRSNSQPVEIYSGVGDNLIIPSAWEWRGLRNRVIDTKSFYGMQAGALIDNTTELAWHQSGSPIGVSYDFAGLYLTILNFLRIGGINTWRLPTLIEAVSICTSESPFDDRQTWMWTSSTNAKTGARLAVSLRGHSLGKILDVGSEHEEFESAVYPFVRAVSASFRGSDATSVAGAFVASA